MEFASEKAFDGVLLDIMMPGLDGLSVCRALRKRSDVPIIFLTALSDEENKLLGYELGTDDYVTKYSLLVCLMRNRSIVMSREQLLVKCCGIPSTGQTPHAAAKVPAWTWPSPKASSSFTAAM